MNFHAAARATRKAHAHLTLALKKAQRQRSYLEKCVARERLIMARLLRSERLNLRTIRAAVDRL